MSTTYDEISIKYWETHKTKVGSSKSFSCYHEGYVYGDEMTFAKIEFVFRKGDIEEYHPGARNGAKWAYYDFVQSACNKSNATLHNFLTNTAEKFRIYSETQVSEFSLQKRNSTRINDQTCKIIVDGRVYYVANNLKVCEYFNSAARNLDPAELENWYIRIYFNSDVTQRIVDKEEIEEIHHEKKTYTITLTPIPTDHNESSSAQHFSSVEKTVKIDYEKLNKIKKTIGDLGEAIVLDYEYKRLVSLEKEELAKRIEHTSKEKGDNIGYDIASFMEDGSPLYIEVKATKQNKIADFYLSRNEYIIGNQKIAEGKQYQVYRLYNVNPVKGTCDLAIYNFPFDSEHYTMQPESWRVRRKDP